jgi:hypothetical protein
MFPEDNKRQKLLQLQENYEIFELMQRQGLQKQYMRNMLHLNNGDGTFSEIAQYAGISNTDWSWSPLVADFDNDGYKDLFVTNGYLRDYTNKDFLKYWGDYKVKKAIDREPVLLMDLVKVMPSTKISNYIYRNNRDMTFKNMQEEWGFIDPVISSGAAYADFDNDGDLDLVINNINQEAFFYQNNARRLNGSNFLSLKILNEHNSPATGSKVYLYTNNELQYQEVNPYRGYLSCVSTILNFGLGDKKNIDSVKVVWYDGSATVLKNPAINNFLEVKYKPSLKNEKLYAEQMPVSTEKKIFTKINSNINYTHQGFKENDFKRQELMLFMYSTTGPVMATADVNKDGLEDLFISGTKNTPGKIYMQQNDHSFIPIPDLDIVNENAAAVAAASFADVNGDGWPDLYVAKGGYSVWEPNSEALQDELYLNDQHGSFILMKNNLPGVSSCSKSCVRPCDFDNDGDIDFFVGGRVIPGRYPETPESFLLVNYGNGSFGKIQVPFAHIGMVTDAQWYDINGDGRKDLFLAGEMMPISVFLNTDLGFENATSTYFEKPVSGFWFSLMLEDVNGDGKKDLVAGNLGLNSQIKCSEKEPAILYYDDFDKNGSIDPFLTFYIQGKSYPYVSRDELNDQMYSMRRKFSTYEQYATAGIEDIFSKEELDRAAKLVATETATILMIQTDGKFLEHKLPAEAQFSAVTKIGIGDYNHDGNPDLLMLGNQSENRLKFGAIDANFGFLFLGDGKGNFKYITQPECGISVKGDVKSLVSVKGDKKTDLFIGISNDKLQEYEY